jgi:biopolymer transport protein ExbD
MRYQTKKMSVSMESLALTDIITNMFIFFFITFSLLYVPAIKEKMMKVDLPKAKTGTDSDNKGLVIAISNDDSERVYFNEEIVTVDSLAAKLQSVLALQKDEPITVKCDKTVQVDRMVKVMDIARGVGATRLNIAIEPARNSGEKPALKDGEKPAKDNYLTK